MVQIDIWYALLNVLISHDKIKDKDLKRIINVSMPTLKKEIAMLNDQLASVVQIHKDREYYFLEVLDFHEFEYVLNGGLKQTSDFNCVTKRYAFILKILMESKSYVFIDDIAADLETSRGTAIRDLKEVKQISKEFNVIIEGTPNKGIKIKGSELDLRLLYLHHVYDYFPTQYYIPKISSYVTSYALKNNIPTSSVHTWNKVLEITLDRIHHGHQLGVAIPHYTNYQSSNDSFDHLIFQIESVYQITLSQYDIDFISFPLNISNTGAVAKTYMNESFVRDVFDQMMQHIKETVTITFNEEILYQEMRFHLLYLFNRLIFHIENYDYFYGVLEQKYPFAYELARIGMDKLEEIIGRKSSEAEVTYLAVYFELMMQEKRLKEQNIAIVCNTGKGTSYLIKQQIEQILDSHFNICNYTEYDYMHADLSAYFAIFTTIPLKNIDAKIPVIRITNLFNDEWLQAEWRKISKKNQLKFKYVDFSFTRLTENQDYFHILSKMIDTLEQKYQVDQNFKHRIFEREQKQTTVFRNGIAFPHAINKQSNRIVFHLGVLGNEYNIKNKIRFIFLVGIPETMTDDTEQELLELYDVMLRITSDQTTAETLYHLEDSSDFLDWLWKENI